MNTPKEKHNTPEMPEAPPILEKGNITPVRVDGLEGGSNPGLPVGDNLANMGEDLSLDKVLNVIDNLLEIGKTCVYVGEVLISCNPNANTGMYSLDNLNKYINTDNLNQLEAHPYKIAKQVWNRLQQGTQHQVINLIGISGSGKSTIIGELSKFFIAASCSEKFDTLFSTNIGPAQTIIKAFGDASTIFNTHSSRHLLEATFHFDPNTHEIKGCSFSSSLLELSRLERGCESPLHLIHQMESDPDIIERLKQYMGSAYTSPPNNTPVSGSWNETKAALSRFCDDVCLAHLFNTLFAILILRRISTDKTTANEAILARLETDLRMGKGEFAGLFYWKMTPNEKKGDKGVQRTEGEKEDLLNALIKRFYVLSFEYGLGRINSSLNAMVDAPCNTIVVRDPPGYENQDKVSQGVDRLFDIGDQNMLYQLVINYANEVLMHSFFDKNITERKKHIQEMFTNISGSDTSPPQFDFTDNRGTLDVLHQIFDEINQLTTIPSNDSSKQAKQLLVCIQDKLQKPNHLQADRRETHFMMRHYAGLVYYLCNAAMITTNKIQPNQVVEQLAEHVKCILPSSKTPNTSSKPLPRKTATLLTTTVASINHILHDESHGATTEFILCMKTRAGAGGGSEGAIGNGGGLGKLDMEVVRSQVKSTGIEVVMRLYTQGWTESLVLRVVKERYSLESSDILLGIVDEVVGKGGCVVDGERIWFKQRGDVELVTQRLERESVRDVSLLGSVEIPSEEVLVEEILESEGVDEVVSMEIDEEDSSVFDEDDDLRSMSGDEDEEEEEVEDKEEEEEEEVEEVEEGNGSFQSDWDKSGFLMLDAPPSTSTPVRVPRPPMPMETPFAPRISSRLKPSEPVDDEDSWDEDDEGNATVNLGYNAVVRNAADEHNRKTTDNLSKQLIESQRAYQDCQRKLELSEKKVELTEKKLESTERKLELSEEQLAGVKERLQTTRESVRDTQQQHEREKRDAQTDHEEQLGRAKRRKDEYAMCTQDLLSDLITYGQANHYKGVGSGVRFDGDAMRKAMVTMSIASTREVYSTMMIERIEQSPNEIRMPLTLYNVLEQSSCPSDQLEIAHESLIRNLSKSIFDLLVHVGPVPASHPSTGPEHTSINTSTSTSENGTGSRGVSDSVQIGMDRLDYVISVAAGLKLYNTITETMRAICRGRYEVLFFLVDDVDKKRRLTTWYNELETRVKEGIWMIGDSDYDLVEDWLNAKAIARQRGRGRDSRVLEV